MSASEKLRALDQMMATPPMDEDWLLPPEEETKALARYRNVCPQIVAVVEWAERVHDEPDDFAAGVGWSPLGDALAALDKALRDARQVEAFDPSIPADPLTGADYPEDA